MASYTPTTWVSGSAPGISAANLNNMETGIDNANADVDAHTADTTNPHSVRSVVTFSTGDRYLIVETGTGRWKAPFACTLISATPTVGVAPTGSSVDVDVNLNGATMFTTKPTIAAGSQDGIRQTPSTTAISQGDIVTVDVDQIGSSAPGKNLTVTLELETT